MNDFGKSSSGDGDGGKDAEYNFYGYTLDGRGRSGIADELVPLNRPYSQEVGKMEKEEKDDHFNNGNNNYSDKKEKKVCEDFEEVLEKVGSQGKYQKILLYGVLSPVVTICPFLLLNTIFMWDIPDHWCHVPGKDPDMDLGIWKNLTLPWEKGPDGLDRHSHCKMIDQISGNETKCQFGWEYDKSDYSSTIPSEFNWVCDRDHYATDCFTMGSIGSAVGTVIFGVMADKYGRKPVFFMAVLVLVVFKTAALFLAHNFTLYKAMMFLSGTAFPAVFSMPALLSAEMSGTDYRAWIYLVTWCIWVVGNAIIPFVAMICRGWFLFGCVAAVPGFFLFGYIKLLDESPRWLITVGQAKRSINIVMKMAKVNGRKVDREEIERMINELVKKQETDSQTQKSSGVWTLFSKQRLAKNTVMLIIAWTMNMLLYYGVTLHTTHMAGNKFINYFILALIELPGGWLAGKLVELTGRRWTQVGFFLLCTLSCLVCTLAVAYPNSAWIVMAGALGIKFGVSITSLVVYLQGTEIFPTSHRSSGSGLASTVASVIGIFGPYIVYSGTVHVSLPYGILLICSFLGMLSAACLPETFKQSLPETIEDANNFGKGQKFWSYLPQAHEKTAGVEGGLYKRSSLDKK